ncbi:MAG: hypothetical protein RIS76_1114 [Verrucomicrobiota bacterium]|jgi:hypothetical protein
MTAEVLERAGRTGKGARLIFPTAGGRHFPPRHRERGGSGRAETSRGGPTARSSDGVAAGEEPPGTVAVGGCEGRRSPSVEADEGFMVINPNATAAGTITRQEVSAGRDCGCPGSNTRGTHRNLRPPLHRQPKPGRTQERPTPNPKANPQFRIPVPRRDWRRVHSVRCTRPDAPLLTQPYPADYRTVAWKSPAGIPGRRLPKD